MTLSQAAALPPQTLPVRPGAAPLSAEPPIRPDVDSWQVGDQRYDSTADLLARAPLTQDGVEATYSFQTAADRRDSRADKVIGGAAIGAVGGAVVGGGLAFVSGIASFLEQMAFYGSGSAVPVLGLVLGTAAVGAAIGAFSGTEGPVETTHSVTGTLRQERQADGSAKPVFYQGGDVNRPVDLATYAQAVAAPPAATETVPWPKDSLVGAGAGAAAGALSIFGFGIGQLFVVSSGAAVGKALAGGRTWGAAVGGAAGLGAVVGTIAAGQVAGFPGLLAATAGLAVGGALLGPVAGPKMRAEAADEARYGKQWWNS